MKNQITQLSYIRILLEDGKYGEALDNVKIINNELELIIEKQLLSIDSNLLDTKWKKNTWHVVNDIHVKYLGNNIFQLANNVQIIKEPAYEKVRELKSK